MCPSQGPAFRIRKRSKASDGRLLALIYAPVAGLEKENNRRGETRRALYERGATVGGGWGGGGGGGARARLRKCAELRRRSTSPDITRERPPRSEWSRFRKVRKPTIGASVRRGVAPGPPGIQGFVRSRPRSTILRQIRMMQQSGAGTGPPNVRRLLDAALRQPDIRGATGNGSVRRCRPISGRRYWRDRRRRRLAGCSSAGSNLRPARWAGGEPPGGALGRGPALSDGGHQGCFGPVGGQTKAGRGAAAHLGATGRNPGTRLVGGVPASDIRRGAKESTYEPAAIRTAPSGPGCSIRMAPQEAHVRSGPEAGTERAPAPGMGDFQSRCWSRNSGLDIAFPPHQGSGRPAPRPRRPIEDDLEFEGEAGGKKAGPTRSYRNLIKGRAVRRTWSLHRGRRLAAVAVAENMGRAIQLLRPRPRSRPFREKRRPPAGEHATEDHRFASSPEAPRQAPAKPAARQPVPGAEPRGKVVLLRRGPADSQRPQRPLSVGLALWREPRKPWTAGGPGQQARWLAGRARRRGAGAQGWR